MRLYFARHGESEANVARVFANRGWSHPLTAAGREQARRLAVRLEGRDVIGVYGSPIRRATETALALSAHLGVPNVTEPGLAEYDVGMFEGLPYADGAERVATLESRWAVGDLGARLPGGESGDEVMERFGALLARLSGEFALTEVAVVLVGHGGTFRLALPNLLAGFERVHPGRLDLGYAGVIEAEMRSGALVCVPSTLAPEA